MRAASYFNNSTCTAEDSSVEASYGLKRLDSPVPYLFGGLALMLALIAVTLIMLACSHRSNDSHDSSADEEKNPGKQMRSSEAADCEEPRIVAIMAGDKIPTYLARPAVASPVRQQTSGEPTA